MRRSVHRNGDYMNRIKRAGFRTKVMTVIFYCIAVFFFVLLTAFAGYVIIKGFAGAKTFNVRLYKAWCYRQPAFNTIYLVFLSLLITVPIGTFAGIYLAKYAKGGLITKFIRICLARHFRYFCIYCCWFIWLPHLSCNYRTG